MSSHFHVNTWPNLAKKIAKLALPILIGQLALVANGVIDTVMTARYSDTDLAALALGSSVYFSIFVGFYGVLQALSPIIGQLFGAGRFSDIGREVKEGMWLAIILSVLGCIVLLHPQPLIDLAHPTPALEERATRYLQILALALPASLAFRVFSAINNAIAQPKAVMTLNLFALALKIPLNYLFIFGAFGIPALGGPGAAIATVVSAWIVAAVSIYQLRFKPVYQSFQIFGQGFRWPHWSAQRALLKLGVPMGLSYLIEVTGFTFMAIFIARMGTIAVDGHQITSNLGAILYMSPLSIAYASGTLVAQAIGANDHRLARDMGNAGIKLAALISFCLGVTVWLARVPIIHLYTPDASVLAAALPLFAYIGFYQLFDAIQVNAAFILRAYKVAVIPTILYALSLWGVGLGLGYVVGFDTLGITPPTLYGATGFWFCNSLSLALVAAGLLFYLRLIHRRSAK